MNAWAEFWRVLFLISVVGFYLLVIAIIPLGAIDLVRLFRKLNQSNQDSAGPDSAESKGDHGHPLDQ